MSTWTTSMPATESETSATLTTSSKTTIGEEVEDSPEVQVVLNATLFLAPIHPVEITCKNEVISSSTDKKNPETGLKSYNNLLHSATSFQRPEQVQCRNGFGPRVLTSNTFVPCSSSPRCTSMSRPCCMAVTTDSRPRRPRDGFIPWIRRTQPTF